MDVERDEIGAWLGEHHDLGAPQADLLWELATADLLWEVTAEDLIWEVDNAATPAPESGTRHERRTALWTAYRLLRGESGTTVVAALGRGLLATHRAEAAALAGLRQAAWALLHQRHRPVGTLSVTEFAATAGIDPGVVADWLHHFPPRPR